MMQHRIRRILAGVLLILLPSNAPLMAEFPLRYESRSRPTRVTVEGTSTLHDWAVEATRVNGSIRIRAGCDRPPFVRGVPDLTMKQLDPRVEIEIPVRSLHSDSNEMDETMYEALKHKQHPVIRYRLLEASMAGEPEEPGDAVRLNTRGRLTVAGVTREIEMSIRVEPEKSKQVRVSGEVTVKMTDFGVEPPTALFGTIRAGDKVTVRFRWVAARVTPAPHWPEFDVPNAWRRAVSGLLKPYAEARHALAGGKLGEAQDACTALSEAAQQAMKLPGEGADAKARSAWGSTIRRIAETGQKAQQTPSLAKARAAFAPLSAAIAKALGQFGHTGEDPWLAFRQSEAPGLLALWLQANSTAKSPYARHAEPDRKRPARIYCGQQPDARPVSDSSP